MSRQTPEELMAGLARAAARKAAPPLEKVVGTRDRSAPRGNGWRRVFVNALMVAAFAAAVIGGSWGVLALRGSPGASPGTMAAGTNATPGPTSSATPAVSSAGPTATDDPTRIGANHVGLAGFVTPSDGWAWAGSASTGAAALMLTTDGGATWADSKLPTEGSVEEVTMLSSRSLRVLVRDEAVHRFELWITDDRGATWFQAPLPDLLYVLSAVAHVAFPTAQVGYVSFARSDPATKETVAIYRSADGGRSWTRLPGEGLGVAQTTSPGFLQALDERQLWLAVGSALYFSADGGGSWTSRYPGSLGQQRPGAIIDAGRFSSSLVGIIRAHVADGQGGNTAYFDTTSDGGVAWRQASPPPAGEIALLDGRTYAAVTPTRIEWTSDAGTSWIGADVAGLEGSLSLGSVGFLDRSHGWVTAAQHCAKASHGGLPMLDCDSALLTTVDGGGHWVCAAGCRFDDVIPVPSDRPKPTPTLFGYPL
jgi:hypothetical protein